MKLTLNLHTVILLAGPTGCGKTEFARALQANLRAAAPELRVAHISSDAIRERLAGPLDSFDARMSEVSAPAFTLLRTELTAHLTWPVNTEVVIVDTTGMNDAFRQEVRLLASESNYQTALVVFNFSHRDYLAVAEQFPERKRTLLEHIDRFKKSVLPSLHRKHYHQSVTIKERNTDFWADLSVEIPERALFQRCVWRRDEAPVAAIGDVHESVAAFTALLAQLPAGSRRLQLGDWLDKGGDTAAMVTAMEAFVAAGGEFLVGNHEAYVVKRLNGKIEAPEADVEARYFTSLAALQADSALAERFLRLMDKALPFVVLQGGVARSAYFTHAPCEPKYLGKLDDYSQRMQRNWRVVADDSATLQAKLAELPPLGGNLPMHVFGHIAHRSRVHQYGRVFLDTGAVNGGPLSAMLFTADGRTRLVQVPSEAKVPDPLFELAAPEARGNAAAKLRLAPHQQIFVKRFVESGARFISGTIAPAPAADGQLESARAALATLRQADIAEVVVQPKYMGSRCQVYLFRGAPEKTFATTRNGYVVRDEALAPVWAAVHARFAALPFWQDTLILDGELLPWRALGGRLIDQSFVRYGAAAKAELDLLAADPVFAGFALGQAYELPRRQQAMATFEDQVALFGAEGDPTYQPFAILAIDGVSQLFGDQLEQFQTVAPDAPVLSLRLDDPTADNRLVAFFTTLTEDARMEGVVIKPRHPDPTKPPALKVRNENYLHIIYGYDYHLRYETLCQKKRIGKKMALSQSEYRLGHRMLSAPDEATLCQALLQMLGEVDKEGALDPRL